jgi:uncharacterized protein
MPRAVVDTTVLISAFLTEGGVAGELLQRARGGAFLLCLSREIIEELRTRLLQRERIRQKYTYTDEQVEEHCGALAAIADLVTELPEVRVIKRDPNDDMIIATALAARADFIVTRDKDLLDAGGYQGIRIVSPEAFMGMLRAAVPSR